MKSKPRFHKQETRYSCVPACLKMVLESFGFETSESELRTLCDTTPISGTSAFMAVEAARHLGFIGTAKYNIRLDELELLLTDGHFPIAFVDMRPIDGNKDIHAVVVTEFGKEEITVLDPIEGERSLPLQVFNTAWTRANNLTILIED